MRKIFYSILTLSVMIVFASCQDDNIVDSVNNPAQVGDEIGFGTSLPQDGIQTRTAYGNPVVDPESGTGYFPVYWENGDKIAIYCPQASMPASKLVYYTIGVSTTTSSTAETVTKIGDAGLQWGSEDLHKFYGFYPVKFVKGTETTGLFDLTLPVEQRPLRFEEEDGNYKAVSNPEYAIMYAYRGQKKSNTPVGTDIDLQFKPLSTILEIEVSAPGNITEPITLTNINVEADGIPIVGDFTAQVYPGSDTEESYESTVVCKTNMSGVVTNNLSVPCSWINEQGALEYVKLAAGKKLVVRAFLIPNANEIDGSKIKITVATSGGTVHKTLTTSDNSFKILPHKVSRVTLPTLPTQYNVNYWMTSLDPDIYLTELSIPGSKFTNTSSYQPTGTEQQYKDGVRAFILHTQASRRWVVDGIFAGHWDYSVSVNNAGTLKESFQQIAQYLENAETAFESEGKVSNEFALVMVTYNTGDGVLERTQQEIWINGIQEEISEMAADPSYRIYNSEVTPETTIEDVRGHIIVKANVNSDYMVTTGATAPILYSLWQDPYGPETSEGSGINYQDKFGGMPLYWQNYQAYDGNSAGNSKLRWYYQEVTTTSNSGSNAEATYQSKVNAITKQFSMGIDLYNKGSHDTWLMNDIGGEKTDAGSGTTSHANGNYSDGIVYSNGIEYTAAELNQLCLNELLTREENAGMGLIFMNFANRGETGKKFQSDLILQTIIDNNFKFALRKKTSSTDGEGTKSYNATYTNGGNAIGWDN